ncbi:hypothetical protein ACSNOK_02440 [Streptomyces sp. URMC 126]|uniref:hypothetical protein n=1 Tax=Streptomyces sp. URMC 126 TaxID=3423401 RepID=UPI003F1A14D3
MTPIPTRTPLAVPAHVARQRRVVLGLFITASVVVVTTVLFALLLLTGTME